MQEGGSVVGVVDGEVVNRGGCGLGGGVERRWEVRGQAGELS